MADLVMRKRPAMHAGEIGLFIDSEAFEEDFSDIRSGVDLQTKVTQPHNLRQFRLAWALATKISQSGAVGDFDKNETMEYLLKKCKHVKYRQNKYRGGEELEVVVKSIRWAALEQEAFNRLLSRMIYIITTDILPDVPEGVIREEIEKMAGITTPDPMPQTPPKRRGRPPRTKPSLPDPVSIIPDTDPVTAGSVPNFPGQPSSSCRHDGEGQPTDSDPALEPATQPMVASPIPPSAEPAPSPVANAERAPITRDLEGWRTYCLAWLEQYRADPEKTDQDVMIRWNADRQMRNACGVTTEERQPVSEVYLNLVDEKRRKVKSI